MTGSQIVAPGVWARTASTSSRPGTVRARDGTAHVIRPSSPTTFTSVRPSIGGGPAWPTATPSGEPGVDGPDGPPTVPAPGGAAEDGDPSLGSGGALGP